MKNMHAFLKIFEDNDFLSLKNYQLFITIFQNIKTPYCTTIISQLNLEEVNMHELKFLPTIPIVHS